MRDTSFVRVRVKSPFQNCEPSDVWYHASQIKISRGGRLFAPLGVFGLRPCELLEIDEFGECL